MHLFTALLTASFSLIPGGQAQLLPAGKFSGRDGRPGNGMQWEVTDQRGQEIAAALNVIASKTPIVIDYEHQTLLAEKNGQPAPAAGWMKSFQWRAGEGLFSDVEWTAKAKTHIAAGEYKFISPVITFDPKTGAVTGLHNAALTNHPALLGMEPVVAHLTAQHGQSHQEPSMELLAALVALFGMAAGTTNEQMLATLTGIKAQVESLTTLRTLFGIPAGATNEQMVAALTGFKAQVDSLTALRAKVGLDDKADLAAIVTKVQELHTAALRGGSTDQVTLAAMQALQGEVARLSGQIAGNEVANLVEQAIKDKKLPPALKDWAMSVGTKDIAVLKTYLANATPIAGTSGQSGGNDPGDAATAALTGAASDVMRQFGLSKEQFEQAAPKA